MKQILISIQPKWVAKILNGDKTIEIRKTMPKCELPCKVYIYCTKEKSYLDRLVQNHNGFYYTVRELVDFDADEYGTYYDIAGKNEQVVAEFTLNKVVEHKKNFIDFEDNECYNFKVCDVKNAGFDTDALSLCDFDNFVEWYGKGKPLYAWHIDNLKIYDEPRELSEFRKDIECHCCFECRNAKLQNPPQSWCYVMEACND